MGPEPIEIPDYFTVAWYREQKEAKRNDETIAAELLISKALLQKWKKQIGWIAYSGKNLAGRKTTMREQIAGMIQQGLKRHEITKALCTTDSLVGYHLKEMGLTRKRA